MDSSDSEDDCYGNIAQKLQRMKNKYIEDKIESTNLLNDSSEVDEIVKNAGRSVELPVKSVETAKKSDRSSDEDETVAITAVSEVPAPNKRVTRSSSKRPSTDVSISESPRPKGSKRRKNAPESTNTQSIPQTSGDTNQETQNAPRSRGRGRNRGRNSRINRQNIVNNWFDIPTYSVGNTDEYPDQSDNQQLFSTKKTCEDVVIVEDNEIFDENEELSVKVYWQSSEFFKFKVRQFQKLSQIFDYFSKKENVSHDKLLFTYKDRILKPDDTPDSIKYSIVKFIDGGIVNQSVSKLIKDDNDKSGMKIKFQCQNVKKPFETIIKPDEKLSVAMMKCAEHFEISLEKLRFRFDGDTISGKFYYCNFLVKYDQRFI